MKNTPFFTCAKSSLFWLLLLAGTGMLSAQTPILNLSDTATISRSENAQTAPTINAEGWNQLDAKFMTFNLGLAVLYDYNVVTQDDNNILQVGEVKDAGEFRADRFIMTGKMRFANRKNPWRYMVSLNYNGLDAPQGKKTLDFIDYNLEIPIGENEKGGWFTLGKQKEGVGHEYVAPGTQGTYIERGSGAPMLVRQRNIGVRYSNTAYDKRMSYTVGVFNNWWETGNSFDDNGGQFTTRVTGLPHYVSDRDYIHIGAAFRNTGPTNGQLTYKAKPEVNTAPSFIITGAFDADGANTLMFEFIEARGPVLIMAEYMRCFVNSDAVNDPQLSYWQVGASWMVTGENRRYNKNTGSLGKLIPNSPFPFRKGGGSGAIELAARYTHSDATDRGLAGGELGRFTTAVGWFLNTHMRLEVNYGRSTLDRNDLTGNADFWQFRAQFEL